MTTPQIILINKPLRWTSFDVVKKVKNVLRNNSVASVHEGIQNPGIRSFKLKVGHAGTLDPLATGLLVICTGSFTKKISEIQDSEKEYSGSFIIGATTPSYDLETEVSEAVSYNHVNEKLIRETAIKFTGLQQQTPPAHSAVKLKGVRAYEKARKGQVVELSSREVNIKEFEIVQIELPRMDFRIVCTKGTYIRSIANDFGKELGCGAYLSALARTRIGEYKLSEAHSMEDFCAQYSSETNFYHSASSS